MKKWLMIGMLLVIVTSNSFAQFSINAGSTNYIEDFNSLANTGTGLTWTNNSTLTGWYAKTDLTASITTYSTNTGSTTAAGLYSFGTASDSDRGLGFAPSNGFTGGSGTGKGYLGWRLVNNTGSSIGSISITWTGEQWRKENNAAAHSLNLTYQTGSTVTDLTAGTWTSASSTFTSPITGATTATSLDGNNSLNRLTGIIATITTTILPGEEIMLRWEDLNDSGNDHQMSIDDITVNATVVADAAPAVSNVNRTNTIPNAGENETVTADVTDDNSVFAANLYYRIDGGSYNQVAMSFTSGNTYTADIPSTSLHDGDFLEYYIEGTDDAAQTTSSSVSKILVGTSPISKVRTGNGSGLSLYSGVLARVSGVCTIGGAAATGSFSSTTLQGYLQDETGAVNIFNSGTSLSMTRGNSYTIVGTISDFNGMCELTSPSITDNGAVTELSYQFVTIAELTENPELFDGELVMVQNVNKNSGTWTSNSSVVVTDGTNNLTVFLSSTSDSWGSISEPGYPADFGGIFTQYASGTGIDKYEIKLRDGNDFAFPSALPVELSSFTVNKTALGAKLIWSTATETNNNGFAIERSSDKAAWSQIGFVAGKGTTTEKQSYSFVDSKASGTVYYRLKQIDNDGKTSFSSVETVTLVAEKFELLNNTPNPFNPSTTIRFALPAKAFVRVSVSNILGQEVAVLANQEFDANPSHEILFDASRLTSGIYFYTVTANGKSLTKSMTLMK